jgi:toxin ParE1/3/4
VRLEISAAARLDVQKLQDFGFQHFEVLQTRTFLRELTAALKRRARSPEIARMHEELTPPARVLPHKSLVIIYRVESDHVKIQRIVYARQNWQSLTSL